MNVAIVYAIACAGVIVTAIMFAGGAAESRRSGRG